MSLNEKPKLAAPKKPPRLTAESRVLRTPSLGGWVNGNTREGRFLRMVERELLDQIAEPTFGQKLLARRASRLALRLELLDEKAAKGKELTDHDLRTLHAMQNGLRLMVRELSAPRPVKPRKSPASLASIVMRYDKGARS